MDRNIIIILISSIVVPWCIYVIKGRKFLGAGVVMTSYAISALWVLMIVLPNVPFLLSPFTPPIHGQVIDAESNQPLANCNIKAYWEIETISIAGGHWETYQQFITKTNAQGEFHIPRRIKVLTIWGFLPALEVTSHYNGTKVLAYAHGFSYSFDKIDRQTIRKSWQPVEMMIRMYKPSEMYLLDKVYSLKSEFKSWNVPSGIITDEDQEFLLEDYRYNYRLFTSLIKDEKSKKNESTLIDYASSLKKLGDHKTAIEVYQKLKNDYPESAQFADQEIEILKRNFKK
jgi:hypothetical protein